MFWQTRGKLEHVVYSKYILKFARFKVGNNILKQL